MRQDTKWYVVPRTKGMCFATLALGLLLLVLNVPRLADGVAFFPVLATLAAAALVVVAAIGLVSPRLRGR